jgi:hypothetical protein
LRDVISVYPIAARLSTKWIKSSLTDTLQLIKTIDEIKDQLGLVYANDKLQ